MGQQPSFGKQSALALCVKTPFVKHELVGFIVCRAEKEEMVQCVIICAATWTGGCFSFLEVVEVIGEGGMSSPELKKDGVMDCHSDNYIRCTYQWLSRNTKLQKVQPSVAWRS